MVLAITFDFPGDAVPQLKLATVRFQEFAQEPFEQVDSADLIDWFEEREEQQFKTRGARGPRGPWPDLADSTWARKKPGQGMMVESGNTKRALTQTSSPHAKREIEPDRVELGIDFKALGAIYPIFHQADVRGLANFPQRPVVDMTEKDGVALMKILQDAFVRRAKEAGWISGKRALGVSRAF